MKLKKILCIMTMALLLVPIGRAVTVYGANTADSPFQFTLVLSNTSPMYTEYRTKENSTSVYVYPMTLVSATKVGVSIRGKNSSGVTSDVSAAQYYYTTANKEYRVDNYAYERGYTSVALGIQALLGNGSTNGVWSPDCANQSAYPQMPHN